MAIQASPLDPGFGQEAIDKGGIFAESTPMDDQLEDAVKHRLKLRVG